MIQISNYKVIKGDIFFDFTYMNNKLTIGREDNINILNRGSGIEKSGPEYFDHKQVKQCIENKHFSPIRFNLK